jgi:tetratricopeptide (TPR) repeat protein
MIIKPFFDEIREAIVNQLEEAKDSISIAVAWFTDKKLFNILLRKLEQNISVQIILCNDAINFKEKGLNWDTFLEKGGNLYAMENNSCLMHHKFAVIDAKILITGSYNWTYKAAKNRENILVINAHSILIDNSLIDKYLCEFEYLRYKAEYLEQTVIYSLDLIETSQGEEKYVEEDLIAEQQLKEEADQIAEALYHNQVLEELGNNQIIEQELDEDNNQVAEQELDEDDNQVAEQELETQEDLLNVDYLYEQGLRLHNKMKYEKAIKKFEQAFELDNQNMQLINDMVWSWIRLFEKYPDTIDFYKCLGLLEVNKNLFKNKGMYYNTLACLYDQGKKYIEAIKYLKEALKYAPQLTVCHWNLIGIYEKTNGKKFVEPIEREIAIINRDYIQKNEWKIKQFEGDIELMQAYYQNAWLYHKIEQLGKTKEYLINAKKVFDCLNEVDQDRYVYNNFIEKLVLKLPKAMQKEFKNA